MAEAVVKMKRERSVLERENGVACPLCGERVRALVTDYPGLSDGKGACTRCLDQIDSAFLKKSGGFPASIASRVGEDLVVFPTPLRLNADPELTGKGVTICFVDSGFAPHPDLTQPVNRILCTVDIAAGQTDPGMFFPHHDDNWHGTMTSVVCAGNGFLSDGFYRGIASEAQLVLLKVKDEHGISGKNIAKAIRWAIENRERYNIRIINLSVTDDEPVSFKESEVDLAAEEAVKAGMAVVAAVGNDPSQPVKPPANSPNVIAVGGVDDHNTLGMMMEEIYHSTFGITVDQFLKPEMIAPSIWLAAPILPMTNTHREARGLYDILKADDRYLKGVLAKELQNANLESSLLQDEYTLGIRETVRSRIKKGKFVSPDYMHADGTSFAAPIVCAVIAQMLQANSDLTPPAIRNILLGTARKLDHVPVERQGYGVVDARAAVLRSMVEKHIARTDFPNSPAIDRINRKVIFYYHDDQAHTVALAGSFNAWQPKSDLFSRSGNGIWKAEIPLPQSGVYLYKFVVDHRRWVSDPENAYREPDGFNGLNSRFTVD